MKNTFKLSRTNNQAGSLFTFLHCQNTKNFAFIALSLRNNFYIADRYNKWRKNYQTRNICLIYNEHIYIYIYT